VCVCISVNDRKRERKRESMCVRISVNERERESNLQTMANKSISISRSILLGTFLQFKNIRSLLQFFCDELFTHLPHKTGLYVNADHT
jgi:hypothetical protein